MIECRTNHRVHLTVNSARLEPRVADHRSTDLPRPPNSKFHQQTLSHPEILGKASQGGRSDGEDGQ